MRILVDTTTIHRRTVWLVQFGLGGLFLFSGFAKLADPYGTYYKLLEYLGVFGMLYLQPILPLVAVLLPAFEFTFGMNALLGVHRKTTSWGILLFMLGMTPLTLYIYLYNPVSDCGCFGDMLKLSNSETFLKNVLLLAAALYFVVRKKQFHSLYSYNIQWLVEFFVMLFAIACGWHSWDHLPLIETQPFKPGINIAQSMGIPEGALPDEYSTTFTYEKEGVKKVFTLENYPANDSTWTFIDSHVVLVKKGYEPPIHPFLINDMEGNDLTDSLLNRGGYGFLLSVPHFEWASQENVDKINALYDYCMLHGYGFCCLTASTPEETNEWMMGTGGDYPVYNTDETTLKSMVRSIPGLLLLHDGTIEKKWSSVDIPSEEELTAPMDALPSTFLSSPAEPEQIALWALMLCVPLLGTFGFERTLVLLFKRFRLLRKLEDRKEEIEPEDSITQDTTHL